MLGGIFRISICLHLNKQRYFSVLAIICCVHNKPSPPTAAIIINKMAQLSAFILRNTSSTRSELWQSISDWFIPLLLLTSCQYQMLSWQPSYNTPLFTPHSDKLGGIRWMDVFTWLITVLLSHGSYLFSEGLGWCVDQLFSPEFVESPDELWLILLWLSLPASV